MVDTIVLERIEALTPWSANARTHSRKQIRQIADSIRAFGFTNPILIDERRTILAGHGRVAAARELGWKEVPCLRLDHMTPDQKRAYVLADNRLAENAGWDRETLAIELGALAAADLDFDIGVIGFDAGEIDLIIEGEAPSEPDVPEDQVLPDLEEGAITRPGDLWQLGAHRIICGDTRDRAVIGAVMRGDRARIVFCDPPYNVPIDGHVCGSGAIRHREFAMASGEMDRGTFTRFLSDAFSELAEASLDGSIHFICMDWRHLGETLDAGAQVYSELKNLIVWAKDNGGMSSFYRSRHELIFAFKNGTAPHVNTFGLGQGGRYRTNVWEYRGMNSGGSDRLEELALHPTVKPVAMIADALRDYRQHRTVRLVTAEADRLELRTKVSRNPNAARPGGMPFSRGHIWQVLTNPIYAGRIRHRKEVHEGQHPAIIRPQDWEAIQTMLQEEAARPLRQGGEPVVERSPLTGQLFDETGGRLTPSHSKTASGKRPRYYISHRLAARSGEPGVTGWRLPAAELETAVADLIRRHLRAPAYVLRAVPNAGASQAEAIGARAGAIADSPDSGAILALPSRIDLAPGSIRIALDAAAMATALGVEAAAIEPEALAISAPFRSRKRGVETKIVLNGLARPVDQVLLTNIARAHAWFGMIRAGSTYTEVADATGTTRHRVQQMLDLAFLAPDIVRSVAEGRHRSDLPRTGSSTIGFPSTGRTNAT